MNLISLFINIKLDIYSPRALPALTNNPRRSPVGWFNGRLGTAHQEPPCTPQQAHDFALRGQVLTGPAHCLTLHEPYTPGLCTPFCQLPGRNMYWLSDSEHTVVAGQSWATAGTCGSSRRSHSSQQSPGSSWQRLMLTDGRMRAVFT